MCIRDRSNSCSNTSDKFPGYNEYNIGLHCVDFVVVAKQKEEKPYTHVGNDPVFAYEVLSMSFDKE